MSMRRRVRWQPETLILQRAILAGGGAMSGARMRLVDSTILRLRAAALWPKFDALYFFAAENSVAALINWKNPGTFNATAVSSPTFTADRGYAGNGSSSYVNSNFTPSTAGGVFTQNSAHVSARSLSTGAASSSERLVGNFANTSGPRSVVIPRQAGDLINTLLNDATGFTLANANRDGHFFSNRSASGATQVYRNGASLGSGTQASTGLPDQAVTFDKDQGNFGTMQVAVGSIGSSLTAAEVATFYAIELAYMNAVGAV